ncbi:MAG: class I SAM-dependent methyltransferase [Candidatus Thiosymbion ectosymbiont of Robbea hypermnestra]|nr:class I SAM-dependent methyltransferase [Candidatus Thiosymbion ectosymbiont of Robbea hypermnestra]
MKESYLPDLQNPVQLPSSEEQSRRWQKENREWWETNPMRYDWKQEIPYAPGTREFYQEIDNRFFSASKSFLPWRDKPFDTLIPFNELADRHCLEIGPGCGSHAQLIAQAARSYTAIDLTDFAVNTTSKRLETFGLDAEVKRMDAERMAFPDDTFDFIWTWGVIHHSANTDRILQQMSRVLRPGGRAVVMVYYRNFWNYFIISGLIRGVIMGELLTTRSLSKIHQKNSDGALARFYTVAEWNRLVSGHFRVIENRIMGQKSDLYPIPAGTVKNRLLKATPDSLGRFFTNTCRMGSFLVSTLENRK